LDVELNELAEYKEIQSRRSTIENYTTNNVGQIVLVELIPDSAKDSGSHEQDLNISNQSFSSSDPLTKNKDRNYMWFINIHTYWNPKKPEVKLLQVKEVNLHL
jgi:hypothetical protein